MSEQNKKVADFKCGNRTFHYVEEETDKGFRFRYMIDDKGTVLGKGKYTNYHHIEGDSIHLGYSDFEAARYDRDGNVLEELIIYEDEIKRRVMERDKGIFIETITSPDGRFISETSKLIRDWCKYGKEKLYDEAGRIKSEINYAYDKRDGDTIFYNPDGSIKERRQYKQGILQNADWLTVAKDLLANGDKFTLLNRLSTICPLRKETYTGGNGLPFSHKNKLHHVDVKILHDRYVAFGLIYDSNFWEPECILGGGIEWIWSAYGAIIDIKEQKLISSVEFPSVTVRDKYDPSLDIHIDKSKFFKVDGNRVVLNFYGAPRAMTIPQPEKTSSATLTPANVIANAIQKQK